MRVLGIMSGTSMDGVDYALCRVARDSVRLLGYWHVVFPRGLRQRIQAAAADRLGTHDLGQLHHDLGRFYARHAPAAIGTRRPQLIGLHGQTVFHRPHPKTPATLQIGEPAYLAETLRVPVVANFRAADVAAGGQGAPLATLFHRIVFAQPGKHVCVNNLGGISNVTSMDLREPRTPRLLAFDTGPANVLIDLACQHFSKGKRTFDRGGAVARRGRIDERQLEAWLHHEYFQQPPPKSTGRELFGEPCFRSVLRDLRRPHPADALATLTEFTARSIALNYRLHLASPPDEVLLAGGGAANRYLVERIRAALQRLNPDVSVGGIESRGWPLQAIEPAAFALLAYYRFLEWPGNLPETTGARHPALLGQIAVA
jgi:anhydro-N-acetylmuramic acid kinase